MPKKGKGKRQEVIKFLYPSMRQNTPNRPQISHYGGVRQHMSAGRGWGVVSLYHTNHRSLTLNLLMLCQ